MDIIFDIDSTLADNTHRQHFIKDTAYFTGPFKPDWESFLKPELVAKDEPIELNWMILRALQNRGHCILFVTARSEELREVTREWLHEKRWLPDGTPLVWTNRHLFMRPTGSRHPSNEVKYNILMRLRKLGYDPKMAFDDRSQDVKMYREQGLMVHQCNEGEY